MYSVTKYLLLRKVILILANGLMAFKIINVLPPTLKVISETERPMHNRIAIKKHSKEHHKNFIIPVQVK